MRKAVFIIIIFMLVGLSFGCGKKQQSLEEMQQPMSMETLVTMSTTASAPIEQKTVQPQTASVLGPVSESSAKLDPLPPSGPYKPTAIDIQTALQNAGFYTGAIDGKIGPVSKKSIIEFQKANNLVADGKVGPKTWGVLEKYLRPVMQEKDKAR